MYGRNHIARAYLFFLRVFSQGFTCQRLCDAREAYELTPTSIMLTRYTHNSERCIFFTPHFSVSERSTIRDFLPPELVQLGRSNTYF